MNPAQIIKKVLLRFADSNATIDTVALAIYDELVEVGLLPEL